MTNSPRTTEEIYFSIRDNLTSKISKMTNFVSGSFNNAFLTATSDQIREAEIKSVASELAGTVDYAGKELTDSDLNSLGIEEIDPEEINEYMLDEHLDLLASNFGIERFEGAMAKGTITVETSTENVEITSGMDFGTQPNSRGQFNRYTVDLEEDETLVSDDSGELEVPIVAEEPGVEYNTGPGTITYVPNPRPGIQSVSNAESVVGGEERESNEELREDIRNALFDKSGGGTESGIVGYIRENSEEEIQVSGVNEFTDQSPPFVDVVVDGGDSTHIQELIDESRPTGIRHNLVRPTGINVSSLIYAIGDSIRSESIKDEFVFSLEKLNIGESAYLSSINRDIMNIDRNIITIPSTNMFIHDVTKDRVQFDENQDVYKLDYNPIGSVRNESHYVNGGTIEYKTKFDDINPSSVSIEAISNDSEVTLDQSDFTVVDSNNDGKYDSVVLEESASVDDKTVITIDYNHNSGSFDSVTTVEGDTFERGVDFEIIDSDDDGLYDSIDWSIGGTSPEDGDRFQMQYSPRRSITGDLIVNDEELILPADGEIDVTTVQE